MIPLKRGHVIIRWIAFFSLDHAFLSSLCIFLTFAVLCFDWRRGLLAKKRPGLSVRFFAAIFKGIA